MQEPARSVPHARGRSAGPGTALAAAALDALPGLRVALFDRDARHVPTHPDASALARVALNQARAQLDAALHGLVTHVEHRGGSGASAEGLSFAPVRLDGKVVGALVIRKQLADERLYRELIEHSSNVVLRADARARYTFVSPSAERIFGWRPDDMVGRPVASFMHPDDEAAHRDMRAELAAGAAEVTIEHRVLHRDGGSLWVESRCRALRDASGRLEAVQTSARDISDRKAAEAARAAADEEFRTAFDDAPIGMALVAPDGAWLRVNDALCRIVGYTREELAGKSFQDITYPDDLETDLALAGAVLAGARRTYQMEKRYVRADGAIVWVQLSVSLVRDHTGAPRHFISQLQDISERKRLEAELTRLATHDPLTGLRNRRSFADALAEQLARAHRHGEQAALLLIDLDGFKAVNDRHGHHVGDALLRHVAEVLTARLRAGDIVARLGGDEFAVLLPHADAGSGTAVAASLAEALAEHPLHTDQTTITASASIGSATLDAGTTSEAAMRSADRAMYRRKQRSRLNPGRSGN